MKLHRAVLATSFLALVACAESKKAPAPAAEASKSKGWQPRELSGAQPIRGAASKPAAAASAGISGKVVETMDSGGYTYVHVDTGAKGKVWAAGPTTAVKVGDTVGFDGGQLMRGFASKTLNRTFESIYFVGAIKVGGASAGAAHPAGAASQPAGAAHPAGAASQPAGGQPKHPTVTVDVGKIDKADGGLTVAEVFAQSAALTGKPVVLRAKVVKFNANIMGKNWLHVQDGSGKPGTNDLTVTTAGSAEVGDVVLVKGVLATNKDFGAGYSYPVILENATITK